MLVFFIWWWWWRFQALRLLCVMAVKAVLALWLVVMKSWADVIVSISLVTTWSTSPVKIVSSYFPSHDMMVRSGSSALKNTWWGLRFHPCFFNILSALFTSCKMRKGPWVLGLHWSGQTTDGRGRVGVPMIDGTSVGIGRGGGVWTDYVANWRVEHVEPEKSGERLCRDEGGEGAQW